MSPYTSLFRVAIQHTDFMLIMSQANNALHGIRKHGISDSDLRLAVELKSPQRAYNALKTASSDPFVSPRCVAKEWYKFRSDVLIFSAIKLWARIIQPNSG